MVPMVPTLTPMVTLAPMVSLAADKRSGFSGYLWYHWLPMVPLVKFPIIPLGESRMHALILLKLHRCFGHGLKICMWFGYSPQIIFYYFLRKLNLAIFLDLLLSK